METLPMFRSTEGHLSSALRLSCTLMLMLSSIDLLTIQLCSNCNFYMNVKLETKNKPFHGLSYG